MPPFHLRTLAKSAANRYVNKLRRRVSQFEQLEARQMLIGSDWSNGLNPLNTDNDDGGFVSPLDALLVVNEINSSNIRDPLTGRLPTAGNFTPPPFVDVNCDQFVTPLDALLVINHLNGSQLPVGMSYETSGGVQGNYSRVGCGAILREGRDFVSKVTTPLTIPEGAAAVTIDLGGIELDTTSQGSIHDAFEIALLDSQGRSLVHSVPTGGDAFFNSSEGAAMLGTSQVAVAGNQVSLSLADVLPGTQANLVFRLVNNDLDTQSAAAIRWVQFAPTFAGGEGQDANGLQALGVQSKADSILPADAFPTGPELFDLLTAGAVPSPGAVAGRAPTAVKVSGLAGNLSGDAGGAASEGPGSDVIDSRGTEFWIGFPDNLYEGGNNRPQKALHIAGDVATTGFVEIPGLIDPATNAPFRADFAVNPGEVTFRRATQQ